MNIEYNNNLLRFQANMYGNRNGVECKPWGGVLILKPKWLTITYPMGWHMPKACSE